MRLMLMSRVESIVIRPRILCAALVVGLAVTLAACGGGSGSSSPVPAAQGLWVPNFASDTVVEFSAKARKKSGAPAPTLSNSSDALDDPDDVSFDHFNNLWVSNCSSTTGVSAGSITEFSFDQLKHLHETPAPSPVITLEDNGNGDIFGCPYGGEFDSDGNLWVVNHFLTDLIEFTPAQLQQGGVQFPHTEIDSTVFEGPVGHTFDSLGAIWITDFHANLVFAFTAQTLAAASGQIVLLDPDIINSAEILDGPAALTFDSAGNQWVANCLGPTVTEFAAMTSSGSPTPLVTLTSTTVTTPGGSAPSLACPDGLAFDRQGNLWVANALSDNKGSLVEFTKSQLLTSGSPTPAVLLDSTPGGDNISQPTLLSFGPAIGH
jgi:sugar lactone lactonase YvrE